jgi:hypothetical protein
MAVFKSSGSLGGDHDLRSLRCGLQCRQAGCFQQAGQDKHLARSIGRLEQRVTVVQASQEADPRPALLQNASGGGGPGGTERSTRAEIHFFLAFLAFFAFAFFAFFAFLAIVSSQGFHGLKRDTEACLAEGQPRNILDCNPTRFGGRCRVPSWRCHHVIHSCYAF